MIYPQIYALNLKSEVSVLYEEIFKKRIDSLKGLSTEGIRPEVQLVKINGDIANAHSKGKINNEHYTNLKNEISISYQEIFKMRIDLLSESSDDHIDRVLLNRIKDEITDAYSEGKISELHYNLLNEKISKMDQKDNTQGINGET